MADNITAPGAGAVLATDDIGGVQYPRSKVSWGVDGAAVDASKTNPLPVDAQTPSIDDSTQNYNVAGVIAINTVLLSQDCARLRHLFLQCSAMGTTGVVTPEWSNNNSTWVAASLLDVTGAVTTTFNAAVVRHVPVLARYFRLRLSTATTAGTTTIVLSGSALPIDRVVATQPVSGTVTVGTLPATPAGTNTIGAVRLASDAGQGASTAHHLIAAAGTNATSVKGSAGVINSIVLSNASAAARFFKLCNTAAAPTPGTTTPVMTVLVPAGQTVSVNCGPFGMRCATGISYHLTTGIAIADTGVLTASDMAVGIFYT